MSPTPVSALGFAAGTVCPLRQGREVKERQAAIPIIRSLLSMHHPNRVNLEET